MNKSYKRTASDRPACAKQKSPPANPPPSLLTPAHQRTLRFAAAHQPYTQPTYLPSRTTTAHHRFNPSTPPPPQPTNGSINPPSPPIPHSLPQPTHRPTCAGPLSLSPSCAACPHQWRSRHELVSYNATSNSMEWYQYYK